MDEPLVSILVISYNSSRFILETLDSAFSQSYKNVELVVSDDGSSDNTVEIVKKWMQDHRSRFVRCVVLESPHNTGIPANCNRAVKAARGEWIRIIAGDDLLTKDGIMLQIAFAKEEMNVIVSDILCFKGSSNPMEPFGVIRIGESLPWFFETDAQSQYRYLLYHYNIGLGISTIVRRNVYEKVAMYDERYPLEEDTMFQLNLTKLGIKYYYYQCPATYYRVHESVSNTNDEAVMNKKYEETKMRIRRENIYPDIAWYDVTYWETELIDYLLYYLTFHVFNNKKSLISDFAFRILARFRLLYYRNKILDRYYRYVWTKGKSQHYLEK